ncbi:MAG: hypothetical protein LBM98_10205 [Oscillospiraceae bacterium]|jgi:hypothetical protein|nr:hypothetical protein [Oscillospiraceae bacterium]
MTNEQLQQIIYSIEAGQKYFDATEIISSVFTDTKKLYCSPETREKELKFIEKVGEFLTLSRQQGLLALTARLNELDSSEYGIVFPHLLQLVIDGCDFAIIGAAARAHLLAIDAGTVENAVDTPLHASLALIGVTCIGKGDPLIIMKHLLAPLIGAVERDF